MKKTGTGDPAPAPGGGSGDGQGVREALARSEEKYRRIFDNIQDIYYEVELDGTILEISPSIERHSPYRREELIGRNIRTFYADPQGRDAFLEEIGREGSVHDAEIRLRIPRGDLLTCSVTAALLPGSEGRAPRIVGSMRDISRRKKAEEALREREDDLSAQTRSLQELNAALRVLLRQREEDRCELQEEVLSNIRTRILPCIARLREGPLTEYQRAALDSLETGMRDIASPFLRRITQAFFSLTPQEIRIADYIRSGHSTKEIAGALRISARTVDDHRNHLRRKLGLSNRSASLRNFLLQFS